MFKYIFLLSSFLVLNLTSYSQEKLETIIQKGHSAAVKKVITDTSGRYTITCSKDKSAKLWDTHTGKEIRSFMDHEFTVNSADIGKDGKLLITGSTDGTAKIWELQSGKLLFTTPEEKKFVTDVAFSPDGKYFITAGNFDQVKIWDLSTKTLIKSLPSNPDQGSGYGIHVSFNSNASLMAIGEDNKTAKIYDTKTWKLLHTFKPENGWCGGCGTITSFSPDNKKLLKLSHNAGPEEYDLETGKLLWASELKFDGISGVYYSGDYIVTSNEKEIMVLSATDKNTISTYSISEEERINNIVVDHKGKFVIAACDNSTSVIYSLPELKKIKSLSGILNNREKNTDYNANNYWQSHIAKYIKLKNEVYFKNDGKKIFRAKTGTDIKEWDVATGIPVKEFIGHNKAVISFDLTEDENLLVTGDAEGKSIVWSKDGKKVHELSAHRHPILSVQFSPDESQIVLSSWDGSISIWDTKSGKNISYIDMANNSAYSFCHTPDGLYLATGRLGKTLELWEQDNKSIVRTFIGHTDIVSHITFHPVQKNLMLTSSWDGTARVWDINTGLMTKKLKDHKGGIHFCLFTGDGKKIITAGDDRIIRIWDFETGKVISKLEGHQAEITNLSLSKNGKTLVSSAVDGMVKFWDLEKGNEFYEHIHISGNDWMAKTRDGYFNGTQKALGYVHFIKGMEVIGSEQIMDKFFKPDLMPLIYKNRGESGGLKKAHDVLKSSPAPTFKINAIPQPGSDQAEILIKIIDNGGGIDEIRLLQNGKRIPVADGWKNSSLKKGEHLVFRQTVSLVHGLNVFQISGYSKERIESAPVSAEFYSESGEINSVCHILSIGIDTYKNPSMRLNFARDDAEAFSALMKQRAGKIFKEIKIHELYDQQASRKNILDTLEKLSKTIQKNDVFVFYYAGHGSLHDENFYFIPFDCPRLYDGGILQKEALEAGILQMKFREIKALKQIVIMDACHSGGSVELLASRGSSEEKAIAQLSRSAGIHILASSSGEQTSKEVNELGHGIFTYLLLNALNGDADGAPKDGKITVFELKSYLDDQTPELNKKYSGKPQYPYTFSRGQDFPLVFE